MPTNMVLIIGHSHTRVAPDDIDTVVNTIQPHYTLIPLNKFVKAYTPPSHAPLDPKVDLANPPYVQVDNIDAGTRGKIVLEEPRRRIRSRLPTIVPAASNKED
jgi:hypothetical protein